MNDPIRRLGSEEVARAADVVRTFKGQSRPPGSLTAFLGNPANYLLVAEVGNELAGFLMAYRLDRADREESQMFVYEVEVAEPWRRRGIASALVREIIGMARVERMFEVFVLTSQSNEAARRLYARAGGRVEDESSLMFVFPLGLKGAV